MNEERLRIGFIPLADAAALTIAVDKGFAAAEGLAVDLVREVSWSNVRDKLNIGVFDAAHLLAPLAVASSLGAGHLKMPLIVPIMLGLNGNAITVSPGLYAALAGAAAGDLADPLNSARALARVVAARRARGEEALTFGMTFPFSTHNYQLRLWMAAGGLNPDEDVQLVVLPPPHMVDSLASRQVDGFCVGAPWNSLAVELGIGRILHFGSHIIARAPEKVLAVRAAWAANRAEVLRRLVRAVGRAADFINDPVNLDEVASLLAPTNRLGVAPELVRSTLEGRVQSALGGPRRADSHYILIGRDGAARPDPIHAAWLYAQMVRWKQAPQSATLLRAAKACFRPDLYDEVFGESVEARDLPADHIGAFTGPPFDADNMSRYARMGKAPLWCV